MLFTLFPSESWLHTPPTLQTWRMVVSGTQEQSRNTCGVYKWQCLLCSFKHNQEAWWVTCVWRINLETSRQAHSQHLQAGTCGDYLQSLWETRGEASTGPPGGAPRLAIVLKPSLLKPSIGKFGMDSAICRQCAPRRIWPQREAPH
jgi:hypothetical protein